MEIKQNIPLSEHTTFRVGGPATFFAEPKNIDELKEAVIFSKDKNLPIFILGEGSNILVSDKGFMGVVVSPKLLGINYSKKGDGTLVKVGAGVKWDDLVADVVHKGLYGLENLSGIPGTVGAAPVQNIGAYGTELKESIVSLEVFDTVTLEVSELSKEDCVFGYRKSIFKNKSEQDHIILSVTFLLRDNGSVNISYPDLKKYFADKIAGGFQKEITPALVRDAVLHIRRNKLPDVKQYGTAGSFFKNPTVSKEKYESLKNEYPEIPSHLAEEGLIKIPAAWIIDKVCNMKDNRDGCVGTYKNQPLAIVNHGGATAHDIAMFAEKIISVTKHKTGITFEWEVERVGNF